MLKSNTKTHNQKTSSSHVSVRVFSKRESRSGILKCTWTVNILPVYSRRNFDFRHVKAELSQINLTEGVKKQPKIQTNHRF